MEGKCPTCFGFHGLPKMLFNDQENPKECTDPFHSTPEVVSPVESEPPLEPQPGIVAPTGPQLVTTPGSRGGSVLPVCPYCGADPCNLTGRQTTMGPSIFMVILCRNLDCRKVLGFIPIATM